MIMNKNGSFFFKIIFFHNTTVDQFGPGTYTISSHHSVEKNKTQLHAIETTIETVKLLCTQAALALPGLLAQVCLFMQLLFFSMFVIYVWRV